MSGVGGSRSFEPFLPKIVLHWQEGYIYLYFFFLDWRNFFYQEVFNLTLPVSSFMNEPLFSPGVLDFRAL